MHSLQPPCCIFWRNTLLFVPDSCLEWIASQAPWVSRGQDSWDTILTQGLQAAGISIPASPEQQQLMLYDTE